MSFIPHSTSVKMILRAIFGPMFVSAPSALTAGEWIHIAVVIDPKEMRLYLNGNPSGHLSGAVLSQLKGNSENRLGAGMPGRTGSVRPLRGAIDEVRVWNSARTLEQIRENIRKQLTGNESNLVVLWNFDDTANPGRDASPNHRDGKLMGNARAGAPPIVTRAVQMGGPFAETSNQVLQLDGSGSYVELPPNIFNDFDQATVEAWVRFDDLSGREMRVFNYGDAKMDMSIMTGFFSDNSALTMVVAPDMHHVQAKGILRPQQWVHVAGVSGPGGMKLYVNGELVGTDPFTGSFSGFRNGTRNYLGERVTLSEPPVNFKGAMDEVRVWKVERTAEEIRENILKRLTGSESGLAALWNFDDAADPGRDASPNHHDGKLIGKARTGAPTFAVAVQTAVPFAGASNRALQLDGQGSFVELPAGAFNGLEQATIESWVNWTALGNWTRMFDFGSPIARIYAGQEGTSQTLKFNIDHDGQYEEPGSKGSLVPGRWLHVACVSGPGGMKLYVDGVLADSKPFTGSFASHRLIGRNLLGRSSNGEDGNPGFLFGQMDEVRVWNVERTAEQIRETISKQLTGNEPGLVGLWNFDDPANPGRDASLKGNHGSLKGNARTVVPGQSTGVGLGTDNKVLALNAASSVKLPAGILDGLDTLSIESWVRWDRLDAWAGFIRFGPAGNDHKLTIHPTDNIGTLSLTIDDNSTGRLSWESVDQKDIIRIGEWIHIAAVFTPKGAHLYINGNSAGSNPRLTLSLLKKNPENVLGSRGFTGRMDEVRLWRTARSEAQIRENLANRLKGPEDGLLALWNFDDPAQPGRDASPNHHDGELSGGGACRVGRTSSECK
jgi:hypothetical protein